MITVGPAENHDPEPRKPSMNTLDALQLGRDAFRRRAWREAFSHLATTRRSASLDLPDLERLATAAHLVGEDDASADLWAHAHHEFLREDEPAGAARCAFWLGFTLMNRGERARGGGWFARAQRVLDECGQDCVERGYLFVPMAMQCIGEEDLEGALAAFSSAIEAGERFSDADLVTLARHGRGRVLIRMGRVAEGVALLDEVMVAVTADELSSMIAGTIYCSVLEACQEAFDVRRAREWTGAMSRWLESQPDLVPYRGQCLVHRSEVMQLRGDWQAAMEEARRACDRLTRPTGQPAAGAAFYQQAELHRLRGEFEEAEEAYREASRWGRKPEPGLPLLRLAQGQVEAATTAIRRAVDEARDRTNRAPLLAAQAEILLGDGDVPAARATVEELWEVADALDADPLRARAGAWEGAVLLTEEDPGGALPILRRAWETWRKLDAPYEAARVRVLIGRACRALGDGEGAELELDAAGRVFRELGAASDLAHVETLARRASGRGAAPRAGNLTPREVEVLRLVAAGMTNRRVGKELYITEKTVARHMSNIFTKLGVKSRTAATAWAYEHDVV
jgi:DNA-binding CsgD family transcriptional regulator